MRWWVAGLLVLALFVPVRAAAQAETGIRISAPASGQVLRGVVEVTGTSAVEGFFASEISFAYTDDLSNWFLIATNEQFVTDGLLAIWDTNGVTDGDYVLRLRVTTQDLAVQEAFVTGLQIRNQTPAQTATLEPTLTPAPFSTSLPPPARTDAPASPAPNLLPTPTSFAPNPAIVTQTEIAASLQRGLAIALISFLVIGILIRLRRN